MIEDESLRKFVYPHVEKLRRAANVLNEMGYLRPGLLRTGRVHDITDPSINLPASYGSFDVVRASEDEYVASGRAMLPERGGPAHAILLTSGKADEGSVVFALDAIELKSPWREDAGWTESLASKDLPKGSSTIEAWAFDAQTAKAFPLRRVRTMEN